MEFSRFKNPLKSADLKDMAIEWALRDVDKNSDKKISMDEFMNDYLTQPVGNLEHYDEDFLEEEKTRFTDDFDRDGNGFIEGEELKFWIGPDNTEIAIEETGSLTPTLSVFEILKHAILLKNINDNSQNFPRNFCII